MARTYELTTGRRKTRAEVVRVSVGELMSTLDDWRLAYDRHRDACPRLVREVAHEWPWESVARGPLRRVYGLRTEDETVGMVALSLNGRTKGTRRSCVSIVLLAKSPQAFVPPTTTGIGRCLILESIRLSFEFGCEGRVRIREAIRLGEGGKGDPTSLYRAMGFEGERSPGVGVEYEDLEITSANAERLIRKANDGG